MPATSIRILTQPYGNGRIHVLGNIIYHTKAIMGKISAFIHRTVKKNNILLDNTIKSGYT
ncbi:hypothetical protein CBFG_00740 [Clostridiales bacterium 1_7_47FAA]|nr:hypothetical protein CBFG_00740 [Clostridiales bacterium 1_7_47FAA]